MYIYVVRKPFKSNGLVFLAGSIVDPSEVKLFRSKINENKIVRLTEDTIEKLSVFIQAKTGSDIKDKLIKALEESKKVVHEEETVLDDAKVPEDNKIPEGVKLPEEQAKQAIPDTQPPVVVQQVPAAKVVVLTK